ncbi:MAG: ubiquinol-cytochrome c reductase cytochrome b subunit [Actinobacteria bacterium]|nr:ubiquinol-cytochrome c reductase cytochrome b subunit [Actinomycetota bacterium]
MSAVVKAGGALAEYTDERLGIAPFMKRSLNKVFPDHWSFMLGEIALYSFIILLLSGTYLTLWFKPSMTEIVYNGSYVPLDGVKMSEAYASTLNISFDVRGGLLMRQIHHWAALFFLVAMTVHMLRVFFTGAFRKPRELNWVMGAGLLTLGILEGFAGYSLPDDLLSGTGLRIAEGIVLAIPILGTWLSFLLFNGEFPGLDFIPRLYTVHVLLIPGIILALVTVHLMLVWHQKHTQYPGPGRTEKNVVGFPLLPVYMAKAGGFFFVVFGVTTLMAAIITINPIWAFGPYTPDQVSAGSQPDWYMGWLDGAVRITPNWEWNIGNYSISWNIFLPAVVLAGAIFTALGAYPFIERWATGDNREHHILDRPRNAPTRTALGVMAIGFYGMLWISGGNDIIATTFDLSINTITYVLRVAVFVVPPIIFIITKRICLSLQRRDHDKLLHGIESGNILRTPEGEFIEIHLPLGDKEKAKILGKVDHVPIALESGVDENGVANPKGRTARLRAKFSHWFYGDNVYLPTAAEIEAAEAHAAHDYHEQHAVIDDFRGLEITSEPVLHSPAIGGHESNPHQH